MQQQQQSQQPHAALQLDHAPDSGHKRAGSWLGTDIDLDCYRANKRYKVQVGASRPKLFVVAAERPLTVVRRDTMHGVC